MSSQPWGAQLVAQHRSKAVLLVSLVLASCGYYLPNVLLSVRTARHQRELFEAFPDAIDLIIACIDAGPRLLRLHLRKSPAGRPVSKFPMPTVSMVWRAAPRSNWLRRAIPGHG